MIIFGHMVATKMKSSKNKISWHFLHFSDSTFDYIWSLESLDLTFHLPAARRSASTSVWHEYHSTRWPQPQSPLGNPEHKQPPQRESNTWIKTLRSCLCLDVNHENPTLLTVSEHLAVPTQTSNFTCWHFTMREWNMNRSLGLNSDLNEQNKHGRSSCQIGQTLTISSCLLYNNFSVFNGAMQNVTFSCSSLSKKPGVGHNFKSQ